MCVCVCVERRRKSRGFKSSLPRLILAVISTTPCPDAFRPWTVLAARGCKSDLCQVHPHMKYAFRDPASNMVSLGLTWPRSILYMSIYRCSHSSGAVHLVGYPRDRSFHLVQVPTSTLSKTTCRRRIIDNLAIHDRSNPVPPGPAYHPSWCISSRSAQRTAS